MKIFYILCIFALLALVMSHHGHEEEHHGGHHKSEKEHSEGKRSHEKEEDACLSKCKEDCRVHNYPEQHERCYIEVCGCPAKSADKDGDFKEAHFKKSKKDEREDCWSKAYEKCTKENSYNDKESCVDKIPCKCNKECIKRCDEEKQNELCYQGCGCREAFPYGDKEKKEDKDHDHSKDYTDRTRNGTVPRNATGESLYEDDEDLVELEGESLYKSHHNKKHHGHKDHHEHDHSSHNHHDDEDEDYEKRHEGHDHDDRDNDNKKKKEKKDKHEAHRDVEEDLGENKRNQGKNDQHERGYKHTHEDSSYAHKYAHKGSTNLTRHEEAEGGNNTEDNRNGHDEGNATVIVKPIDQNKATPVNNSHEVLMDVNGAIMMKELSGSAMGWESFFFLGLVFFALISSGLMAFKRYKLFKRIEKSVVFVDSNNYYKKL